MGLRGASGEKDNMTYGTAVHKAFQYTVEYAMKNKKYPSANEAYEVFSKCIDESPSANPENLKQSAKDNIFSENGYYQKFIEIRPAEQLDSRTELPLNYTDENGISFNGNIDRIDKNPDGSYTIYDYKTGTDNSGITKGGVHMGYYYQIAFYKYLFKKQYNIDADISTCFIYPLIEHCHNTIEISDTECEEIANEYKEITEKIANMEFERPEKCKNEKFCDCKSFCKMNVI